MKILIIINCIVAIITFILALEIAQSAKAIFKKDYPNVKLNKTSTKTRIIGFVTTIIRLLIPIYNIIILFSVLFMRNTLIDEAYEMLINRIVED